MSYIGGLADRRGVGCYGTLWFVISRKSKTEKQLKMKIKLGGFLEGGPSDQT
jgi:hypothetical protein